MAGGASGIKAGRAYVELGVKDDLAKGLAKARESLKALGDGIKAMGMTGLAVGGGLVGSILGAAKVFADTGSEIHDMSQRTGLSAEALSELGYVAGQAGVEMGSLESSVKKMQKSVEAALGGSESMQETFQELGLAMGDLQGKSPEELFTVIGDRVSRIADPTQRAAMAMKVFGKAGTDLLPMLEKGAAGLAAGRAEAQRFGLTVSKDAADSADALGDAIGLATATLKKLAFEIGGAVAPLLTDLAMSLATAVAGAIRWVQENRELIVTAFKWGAAIAAAGAALVALGTTIVGVGAVLGSLVSIGGTLLGVLGAFGTLLGVLLSPVGLVTAAVVGLGAALLSFSGALGAARDYAGKQFDAIYNTGKDTIGGIADALRSGDLGLAAQIAVAGIKLAFFQMMEDIRVKWAEFKGWIGSVLNGANFTYWAIETKLEEIGGMNPRKKRNPLNDLIMNQVDTMQSMASAINDAHKDVDDAKARLDELRNKAAGQAASARATPGAEQAPQFSILSPSDFRQPDVAGVLDAIAKISSTGTFNADAALGLQASSSPIQTIAKATERTASNTGKLVDMAKDGGLVFEE